MTLRTRRGLACAVLAAFLPLALGGTAQADPERLRLSLSESGPFTETLATPLFSGSYVPGEATSSFFVENDSPSTTRATISLAPTGSLNAFGRALSFAASVGGTTGAALPLHTDRRKNQCRTMVTGPTIAPGGVQRVDVTMGIDPDLPQPATPEGATVSFVVTLSQVTVRGKVDACGPSSDATVRVLGSSSTSTSAPVYSDRSPAGGEVRSSSIAWLAAVLFGLGALLVGRSLWMTDPADQARR